ncbi:MAG TPA: hypothetical protein VFB99_17730 [Vicinamibacterales bacterium]|nr:hypothetical protein [Vicinamibacterales bacterium]
MTLDDIYASIRITRQGYEGHHTGLYCVELRDGPDDIDPLYLWVGIPADEAIVRTRMLGQKLAGVARVDATMAEADDAHVRFLARSPIAEYARAVPTEAA